MYHRPGSGGVRAKKELFPSCLGGLDVKYLQEVYLDTTSTFSSPSISPTSTDTPITPLSPIAPTVLTPNTFQEITQSPNSEEEHQQSFFNCANKCLGTSASTLSQNNAYFQQSPYSNHLLLQQQQQQQQLAAALVAQQQQQKNEISKSLKMFAMLAAYKSGNESPQPQSQSQSPVDAIMQDFARNGYVSDDLSLYQQHHQQQQQHLAPYQPYNGSIRSANNVNVSNNTAQNQSHTYNSNLTEMRKNFWMFHLPTQSYLPSRSQVSQSSHVAMAAAVAAAATAAVATNIEYNNSSSNSGGSCSSSISSASSSGSGYSRRPQKRSNTNKPDKFSIVKHCVFCENNNEPEAVVKSHAVRDSFGRVLCPKLRTYICPICKASGDFAHTVKYCPQKPIITMEDALKAEAYRLAKSTYYKQQMKV